MEKRFAYHPKTREFIDCNNCHSTKLYNLGKQKDFDQYIRGIIKDNTLYLRTFYPFKDIDYQNFDKINEISYDLLFENKNLIINKIKEVYNININKIEYNMINDLLKGILTNI